jgi:hypothetical protein
VANFCTGDVCSLPNEQALVTQRGLPLTTCQALCLSADAGGLSAAGTKLVSPPYQINNGLSEEPLNTKVRARQPLPSWHAACGGPLIVNSLLACLFVCVDDASAKRLCITAGGGPSAGMHVAQQLLSCSAD